MSQSPRIQNLLDREGSDKGKWYGEFYDFVFAESRLLISSVLEIGIGTMLPEAPSTMLQCAAPGYRPGGSLRAWRDFFPNALIYGVDIQPDTQFDTEDRVITFLCDSADGAKFSATVTPHLPLPVDVIIDDGLHVLAHQLKTFENLFPLLRPGGLYIIEDIWPNFVAELVKGVSAISPASPRFVIQSHHPEAEADCMALVIKKTE